MKTLIAIFLLISCWQISIASSDTLSSSRMGKLKRCYGQASFGGGIKGIAIGLGGGFIRKKDNWGMEYFVLINPYRSKNRPDDYKPSSNFFYTNSKYPKDNAYIFAVTLAKEFNTDSKKNRFAVAAGPSFTSYSIKSFKSQKYESFLFSNTSNYETLYSSTNSLGIALKGSVAFMPRNKFGMQLSAIVNVNTKQSYIGLQYELIWGKLWDKPKKIKQRSDFKKFKKIRV